VLLIASAHITVARVLAWVLAACVLAGALTLVHAYRYDPDREPVGALRFWGAGLLGTIGLTTGVYVVLGESWGTPALPLGAFAALAVERYRERKRRSSGADSGETDAR
jgi:hypothetical protein